VPTPNKAKLIFENFLAVYIRNAYARKVIRVTKAPRKNNCKMEAGKPSLQKISGTASTEAGI
jgi:hypothetical protein